MAEFIIKFDPVMKIGCFHGCLYQPVKEGPAWPADMADKVNFLHQEEDSMLCG